MFTKLMHKLFPKIEKSFLGRFIRTERELAIWSFVLLAAVLAFAMYVLSAVGKNLPEGVSQRPREKNPGGKEVKQKQTWTCSMHPQVQLGSPGRCPLCGMDLILAEEGTHSHGPNEIAFTESAKSLGRLSTVVASRGQLETLVWLTGRIELIPGKELSVHLDKTHTDGRVGKVFAGTPGILIRPGDLLFEVFAEPVKNPDFFRAPIGGLLLAKSFQSGDSLREGQELYILQSLEQVWVSLDAYEKDLAVLRSGQPFTFEADALPGKKFQTTLTSVDAVLKPETRTVAVRALMRNADLTLLPGMIVRGQVKVGMGGNKVLIPSGAPLITGKRAVVFVERKEGGEWIYEYREIHLGAKSGDHYAVESGLEEGETVVAEGAFKIDAAMQIRGKKSLMTEKTP